MREQHTDFAKSMVDNPVVVTGRGVVSAFGNEISDFEKSVFEGRSAIGDFTDINDKITFKNAAPIRGFDPIDFMGEHAKSRMDLFSQFAFVAAKAAVKEACLVSDKVNPERIGVVMGTANPGLQTYDEVSCRVYRDGRTRVPPMTVPLIMGSAPSSHIAQLTGARGPVFGVTSACASAHHAITSAISLLLQDSTDIMLCGGTDACFSPLSLLAWEALRVVSTDTCRPFSADRSGLILGEGAGVFVLERLAHARKRGVTPLAKILGAGMSSDAGDLLSPERTGMESAMRQAIRNAELSPSDVEYINAHGTGTMLNDKTEASAIHAVFGKRAKTIPVSSTKSQIGHALGASGALELLAVIAALQHKKLPPNMNFTTSDPECPLNIVANESSSQSIDIAVSNSFAFGGLNTSLIVGRI